MLEAAGRVGERAKGARALFAQPVHHGANLNINVSRILQVNLELWLRLERVLESGCLPNVCVRPIARVFKQGCIEAEVLGL